jgi:hypothetical protein
VYTGEGKEKTYFPFLINNLERMHFLISSAETPSLKAQQIIFKFGKSIKIYGTKIRSSYVIYKAQSNGPSCDGLLMLWMKIKYRIV